MRDIKLIFEKSIKGRTGYKLPELDVPEINVSSVFNNKLLREEKIELPEVSEVDIVRHYTQLSKLNHGVDSGLYPLGSCTMKYNPKINEDIASNDKFINIHPLQIEESVQGSLQVFYECERLLCEITGMDNMTMQPSAGAHGEMTGIMIIKEYHKNKNDKLRTKIIVPDSAHGTNPASAKMVGYDVVEIKSNEKGLVDINDLKEKMDNTVAGLMLTNPNTLGLFEENILEISKIVHDHGGLLYYDGANANAILGIVRPGDMGFDVMHLNLHKTFSTPHGGGGPGSGPVGVKKHLEQFLPMPIVKKNNNEYSLDYNRPNSIGKIKAFYGNFLVVLKAYSYILSMGAEGLKEASQNAILNANYLATKLKEYYELPFDRFCMHEFVLSGENKAEKGVHTLDIAKRLIDFDIHPPTIYFPLIVKEAMMIEPTETESKETLDEFVEIMKQIAEEIENNPDLVKNAPSQGRIGRLDDVAAARKLNIKWD